MRYKLADNLSCCIADGRPILLDLARDRYFAPPSGAVTAFLKMLQGADLSNGEAALLEPLARADHVVNSDADERWTFHCPVTDPVVQMPMDALRSPRIRDIAGACFALAWATVNLRRRGLKRTLARLAKRARRRSTIVDHDAETVRVVSAFAWISMFWSAHNRCLVCSIAMKRLLDRYDTPSDLLIGVTGQPFTAHCWVQQGPTVLNDDAERVRRFTVIHRQ